MRLVDADALMSLFVTKAQTMKDTHGVKLGEEWLLNYNDIEDVIDNAPTVLHDNYSMGYQDGVKKVLSERPHGEWIDTGDMNEYWAEEYQCSICGAKDHWHNYCPHCGADMREEAFSDDV